MSFMLPFQTGTGIDYLSQTTDLSTENVLFTPTTETTNVWRLKIHCAIMIHCARHRQPV
jgi:hypothetical protein